eukprot:15637956-Heterocapsa_arctica.AAC.1
MEFRGPEDEVGRARAGEGLQGQGQIGLGGGPALWSSIKLEGLRMEGTHKGHMEGPYLEGAGGAHEAGRLRRGAVGGRCCIRQHGQAGDKPELAMSKTGKEYYLPGGQIAKNTYCVQSHIRSSGQLYWLSQEANQHDGWLSEGADRSGN